VRNEIQSQRSRNDKDLGAMLSCKWFKAVRERVRHAKGRAFEFSEELCLWPGEEDD